MAVWTGGVAAVVPEIEYGLLPTEIIGFGDRNVTSDECNPNDYTPPGSLPAGKYSASKLIHGRGNYHADRSSGNCRRDEFIRAVTIEECRGIASLADRVSL